MIVVRSLLGIGTRRSSRTWRYRAHVLTAVSVATGAVAVT
jgi:hypothetical protein